MKYPRKIINKVLRIYRTWRMLRLAEKKIMIDAGKNNVKITEITMIDDFMRLKKVSGRNYSKYDAIRALMLAEDLGFIVHNDKNPIKHRRELAISNSIYQATTLSWLVDNMVGTMKIATPIFISLTAAVIAAISLYVSLTNK